MIDLISRYILHKQQQQLQYLRECAIRLLSTRYTLLNYEKKYMIKFVSESDRWKMIISPWIIENSIHDNLLEPM